MKPTHVFYAFRPELQESDLPAGVIGRVAGIALVYDVIDGHGSTFARGALDRTIRERVAAGKVKLFWDHGDSPGSGFYDSDLHIGTVRSITDVRLADGHWGAYMVADLLDTPKAHEVKQYLQSVLSSGGETGLSIGCIGALTKGIKSEITRIQGEAVERITEFPLSEISITSMQSVPDSEVLAVRAEPADEPVGTIDGDIHGDIHAPEPAPEVTPSTVPPPVGPPGPQPTPPQPIQPRPLPPRPMATRTSMEAAFEALAQALPPEKVRAITRAVLGDADPEDSNAAAAHPRADSDAEAEDSRTPEEVLQEMEPAAVYATMEDRIRALRHSYAEAP